MCHKSATSWQAVLESLQIAGARKKTKQLYTVPKSSISNKKRKTYKAAHWPANCYNLRILAQVSPSPRRSKMIYIYSETVTTSVSRYSNQKIFPWVPWKGQFWSSMQQTLNCWKAPEFSSLFQSLLPMPSMSSVSDRWMNLIRQDLVCSSNCTSTSHCNNTLLHSCSMVNKVIQLNTA